MSDRLNIETKNPKPVSLGRDTPRRMEELFSWVASIDSWDYCDPKPLSEMISYNPIPDEIRPIIADIVSGVRQQNKRGASKLKVDADQRMAIAATTEILMGIGKGVLAHRIKPDYFEIADKKGIEYGELRAHYNKVGVSGIIKKVSEICGVSTETIENLLRELREKKKNWPNI